MHLQLQVYCEIYLFMIYLAIYLIMIELENKTLNNTKNLDIFTFHVQNIYHVMSIFHFQLIFYNALL